MRIRGGSSTPRARSRPRSRAAELGELLILHGWGMQPWSRRISLLFAFAFMGAAKLAGVRSTFALARAIDSAALLSVGQGGALLITPAARALIAYVSYLVGAALCEEVRRCLFVPVAQHAVRSLSTLAFSRAHARDCEWHQMQPAGGLDRIFHRSSRALQALLSAVTFSLAPTLFEAVLVLVVLRRQFGQGVCLLALATFLSTIALGVVANELRRAMYTEANRQDVAVSSHFVESLRAHELVKLSSAEALELSAYQARISALSDLRIRLSLTLALLNASQRAAFAVGLLLILLLALRDVRTGAVLPSKLLVLNGLLRQLSSPVQQLGSSYTLARQACIDLAAMLELTRPQTNSDGTLLDEQPALPADLRDGTLVFDRVTVELPAAAAAELPAATTEELPAAAKAVAALPTDAVPLRAASKNGEDDRPRAAPAPTRLLDGVSFSVARGERVALVGPSGAGKSTVLRVLSQFVAPSAGSVSLGGHALRDYRPASVLQRMAIVPQDCSDSAARSQGVVAAQRGPDPPPSRGAQDTDGTAPAPSVLAGDACWFEEAVRYAAPNATSAQIEDALQAVGLGAQALGPSRVGGVSGLEGFDARRLSAGELQRLALARALARGGAVLACDEPTSNLDALSAARASMAIKRAAAERAVLVVAHDLRTIVDFDRIVVLDGGRCVDQGTHAELLRRCALYRRLWETQSADPRRPR
jgi:ATP-binding cassette subfamily B protein